MGEIFMALLFMSLFIYPVLTIMEIRALLKGNKQTDIYREIIVDISLMFAAFLFTSIYFAVREIYFDSNWYAQLVNDHKHTPIHTEDAITFILIACVGLIGYLVSVLTNVRKTPPLVTVLGISMMYLGTLESIFFTIQLYLDIIVMMIPLNCLMISIRVTGRKVKEYQEYMDEKEPKDSFEENDTVKNRLLWKLRKFLDQSRYWPVLAFLFMIPLLGIIVMILMLFGQRPDSVIRMFTETADWNFSQQIAPPNISVDEHYLCTVAAGGHEKIVKPKRKGIRHGHEVIVNRQLCIANAFEQILEERTPKLHRMVRNFYDKYGFPVARMIRTKAAADVVYLLMKPLEWFFLLVLYLTDVDPESRIAIQYTGKSLQDFKRL